MPTIKVPGKLMLTGEWSILEPGNQCIVMAVDKYLSATITPSNTFIFNLPDLKLPPIEATYTNGHLSVITPLTQEQETLFVMCKTAATLALELISRWIPGQARDDKWGVHPFTLTNRFCHPELDSGSILSSPFTLTLTSEISTITMPDGSHHKLGFGSSAAAVVATIKAIFAFYEYDITKTEILEQIFKLAVIAHYTAQGNCGSGFDIAAATYGTTLMYQRFNPSWLEKQPYKDKQAPGSKSGAGSPSCTSLTALINTSWPDLKITPFKLPQNLIVLVGFSGKSANTSALITAMHDYKKREPENYQRIISAINTLVKNIEQDMVTNNYMSMRTTINNNRALLAELAQKSGINLETQELTNLITIAQWHGAAAKFSGAGGGDCGIALCTEQEVAEKIKADWQAAGLVPIDVKIL